jgi:hypothetical protein
MRVCFGVGAKKLINRVPSPEQYEMTKPKREIVKSMTGLTNDV